MTTELSNKTLIKSITLTPPAWSLSLSKDTVFGRVTHFKGEIEQYETAFEEKN